MNALRRFFTRRNPARDLALMGVEKRRRTIRETTKRIREELGLPPDSRLA